MFRCDQHLVGEGFGSKAEAEQGSEGGVADMTAVEAEHELVEVGLEMVGTQPVIDAVKSGSVKIRCW